MADIITNYNVFIASPRGLEEEREQILDIFESFNKFRTLDAKITFNSVDYKGVPGGMGRPQSQINELIKVSDFFILLLYDKWGTPPFSSLHQSKYTSGTEEEFYIAMECYQDAKSPMRQILPIFKALEPKRLEDPGDELKKVLAFKSKLENEKICFYDTFDNKEKFRKILEKNLSSWLNNIVKEKDEDEYSKNTSPQIKKEFVENKTIELNNQLLKNKKESLLEIQKLIKTGQFSLAELMYARLSTIYPDNFDISIEYARFYIKRGLLQYAIEILNKLLRVQFISEINIAIIYREKGIAEEMRGNNNDAEKHYRESIELLNKNQKNECWKERVQSIIKLGNILRKQGKYPDALSELNSALSIYSNYNELQGQAKVNEYLGLTYKSLGKIEEAENCYNFAIKLIDYVSDETKANILGNLGVILRMKGQYVEAKSKHEDSYRYYLQIGDKKGQERELSNLGIVYRRLKEYDKSQEMHEASLKIARECGHTNNIIIQLDNLGITALEQENFEIALEHHFQALGINQSIKNKSGLFYQLRNIGNVYLKQREYESARDILLQAKENMKENEFEMALIDSKLAEVYFELGEKVIAHQYAKSAYEILKVSAPGYSDTKNLEKLIKEMNKIK